MPDTFTTEQVHAARALLRWRQADLAEKSGVPLPTLKRLESQPGQIRGRQETRARLREALEAAGIAFLAPGENGPVDGAGVRLRQAGE